MQSFSVCLLKIGAFKVHLYCASFIKLIRVSTVVFWPALQVSNSQFKTITLSEQSLHSFVCVFVCLFVSFLLLGNMSGKFSQMAALLEENLAPKAEFTIAVRILCDLD